MKNLFIRIIYNTIPATITTAVPYLPDSTQIMQTGDFSHFSMPLLNA